MHARLPYHGMPNAGSVTMLTVDGINRCNLVIPLVDDRQKQKVDLRIPGQREALKKRRNTK
jgi:hypothetical protein